MAMRLAEATLEDPRFQSFAMVALVAAAMWLALAMWMDEGAMHGAGACLGLSAGHVAQSAAMWVAMMSAMMLPAAAPAVSTYSALCARDPLPGSAVLRTGGFCAGYLAVWSALSLAFAAGQIVLGESGVFEPGGMRSGPLGAGLLMLAAGAYELTPLKQACLSRCRNPMTFFLANWREGAGGAFALGARHGLHCVGCCVAMMGLMFLFGAMNLIWMAVLAVYFIAEKVVPGAGKWSRKAGLMLIGAGALQVAVVVAGPWFGL